jgi:hypothetical protein
MQISMGTCTLIKSHCRLVVVIGRDCCLRTAALGLLFYPLGDSNVDLVDEIG